MESSRPLCIRSPLVFAGAFLAGLASTPPVSGAEPVALVVEGDVVPGVGAVTRIDTLAINDRGDWLVEVDTDHPDTDADSVLLSNGSLALREGQALASPAGSLLDGFDSITLDNAGRSGFNFLLDGTTGSGDDSTVSAYLDTASPVDTGTVVVLQEGQDAPGFPAGTPTIGFFDVKINDAGQLLVTASIDAAAIPTTVDRALYLWTSDAASGGVTSSTLIAAEGDVLPGQSVPLADFGTGPHETALNAAGEVLFGVDIPGGLDAVYFYDGTLVEIAQEGDPSPVAGRPWAVLTSTALDLNAKGQHVYRGTLEGDSATASLIVRDGAGLIQEGDTLPAIGGVFTFTSFGTGPVLIADDGGVLWFGDWDDPDTDIDTGLFVDHELVVQEGVTEVSGLGVIDTLRGITDGYQMSDDGCRVVFEAVLVSGVEGAFLLDRCGIFSDGFESGDTSAWSAVVP